MPSTKQPSKLSRKEIDKGLAELPMSAILGKQVSDALTPKQREFARKVAQGKSKVSAYREAYPTATSPNTLSREPYMLARDPRIIKEIEAYALAIEAAKHRTPAALRELVIQTLTQTLIDPETTAAVKLQAAKILGTVTEVAAFTERKEVRTISSSEDARARVMAELRGLITSSATDATMVEADSLLAELAGDAILHPAPDCNITPAEPAAILHPDETDADCNITGAERNAEGRGADPPVPHPPK